MRLYGPWVRNVRGRWSHRNQLLARARDPAAPISAPAVQARPAADVRRLFLHNLHTGDTVKTE